MTLATTVTLEKTKPEVNLTGFQQYLKVRLHVVILIKLYEYFINTSHFSFSLIHLLLQGFLPYDRGR